MSLRDDELNMEDVVWLIGYLADNAPPDLLIPPRLAPAVKGYRKGVQRRPVHGRRTAQDDRTPGVHR